MLWQSKFSLGACRNKNLYHIVWKALGVKLDGHRVQDGRFSRRNEWMTVCLRHTTPKHQRCTKTGRQQAIKPKFVSTFTAEHKIVKPAEIDLLCERKRKEIDPWNRFPVRTTIKGNWSLLWTTIKANWSLIWTTIKSLGRYLLWCICYAHNCAKLWAGVTFLFSLTQSHTFGILLHVIGGNWGHAWKMRVCDGLGVDTFRLEQFWVRWQRKGAFHVCSQVWNSAWHQCTRQPKSQTIKPLVLTLLT